MNTPQPTRFFAGRNLLMVSIMMLTAFGCDETLDAKMGDCRIMKSHAIYNTGETEDYIYTFSAEGALSKWVSVYTNNNQESATYTCEFEYDGEGRRIKEIYDVDGYYLLTYNDLDQVIREEIYQYDVMVGYFEMEYNTDGQRIKRQHYDVDGDVATADYYTINEYASATTKNILHSTSYYQDGTVWLTYDYEHDDKINPWALMGMSIRENNITKQTRTEGSTVKVIRYTYRYNSAGYPVEMTYTNESGVDRYTEVYTYDCE